MPWRWGPPNRGIRASASYASPPYSGASCVFCFYRRGVPTLANLVVPLFLIASLCSMSKRGDFFLPRCGPSYAVPSCLRFASPHPYHAVGRSLGRFASSHPIISSMDGSACPACLPPPDFFNAGRRVISSRPAFLRLRRSASPPAVLPFFLSFAI